MACRSIVAGNPIPQRNSEKHCSVCFNTHRLYIRRIAGGTGKGGAGRSNSYDSSLRPTGPRKRAQRQSAQRTIRSCRGGNHRTCRIKQRECGRGPGTKSDSMTALHDGIQARTGFGNGERRSLRPRSGQTPRTEEKKNTERTSPDQSAGAIPFCFRHSSNSPVLQLTWLSVRLL